MRNHKTSSMYCWIVCSLACLAILAFSSPIFAQQNAVNVGVVGAMKFTQGEHTWNGAEIAAEEINAAGGIKVGGKSYRLNLIKADSNEWASIADATGAMERVINQNKVKMVMGGYRSEAALAMQDVAAEYKIIYFSVGAGHGQISKRLVNQYDKYKYWFREGQPWSGWASYVLMGNVESIAQKFRVQLGVKSPKVAILAEKVLWADEMVKLCHSAMTKLGLEDAGTWRVSAASSDLRAEFNAIKAAGAHICIDLVSGPVGIATGRQWGSLKMPFSLIGYSSEAQKKEYWETTEHFCEGEALLDYVTSLPVNARSASFWDKYTKRYGTFPMNCALSYNALWIWKEAVERAGTFATDNVIPEIEKTNFKGVGGTWRYNPKGSELPHDIIWAPDAYTEYMTQWRKGKKVVIWPDGKPLLGDKKWENVKFKGTKGTAEYMIPPWVAEYWKAKK